ncbi:MAG: molybdate ABC transporter permease subunit [Actinomycetota bacterium]
MTHRARSTGVPPGLVAIAVIGVAFVTLPIVGIVLRADWSRAGDVLPSSSTVTAFRLSLTVATAAAIVDLVLGVPVALLLTRVPFRGKTAVRALVVLPLVLPPVVGGVGLLAALGRRGILGGPLEAVGVTLPFTTTGAVVATAFVSFPLVVLATEAGLRSMDGRLEDAARAMGGRRWYVLRRVTLPLLLPQLVAGGVLAWARALGEFGATLMFAGNLAGRTQTLPLAVFEVTQTDPRGALLVALLLVVVSIAVLVALRGRFLGSERRGSP